jgi:lipopolysaccharide export system protein LptA
MKHGLGIGLAVAALFAFPASGQRTPAIKIDVPTVLDFKAPIADEQGRTVALVSGAKMTPSLAAGDMSMDVTGFRLETFRYSPERTTELVVESALGRFGPQGAGSAEPMTLRSADGRFSIAGMGWSWTRTNGLLVISNAVQTTLRRGVEATNRPPIGVTAGRFEYDLRTGDARYLRDCVAEDPGRARVRAGELRSRLRPSQAAPEAIVGTNGVSIEMLREGRTGRAAADQAVYTAADEGVDERVEMTGRATWELGSGEGAADRLVLVPGLEAYTASGNARLRLRTPAPAPVVVAEGGAEAEAEAPGVLRQRELLEIACQAIEARSTNVVLTGPVTARQGDRLEVVAEGLTAVLGPDPRTGATSVHRARAVGGVVARVGQGTEALALRGDVMAYTLGDPSWIEVSGNPSWKGGGHGGTAERFRIEPERRAFEAQENVLVQWESAAVGTTNTAPVRIAARSLSGDATRVAFSGGVKAEGERWRLGAGTVDMGLGTNRTVRTIRAETEVRFFYEMLPMKPGTNAYSRTMLEALGGAEAVEVLGWAITAPRLEVELGEGPEGRGETLRTLGASGGVDVRHAALAAKGERLTYNEADGLLRLAGDPEIRAVHAGEILGQAGTVLTVDPATGILGVQGPVRRWVLPAALLRGGAGTNSAAVVGAGRGP